MDVDRSELRRGLAAARPYLLAHHVPGRRDRCYRVGRFDVCARCAGVYPGIVLGVLAFGFAPRPLASPVLVAVLPLPALLDWTITTLGHWSGTNIVRTATGAALGYGYGLGLGHLLLAGDLRVLAVGVAYAALAGGLLAVARRGGRT
ncbi:MAG: DUF2085 domain-containing protein [Halococcoides sp.]